MNSLVLLAAQLQKSVDLLCLHLSYLTADSPGRMQRVEQELAATKKIVGQIDRKLRYRRKKDSEG